MSANPPQHDIPSGVGLRGKDTKNLLTEYACAFSAVHPHKILPFSAV